MKLLHISDLHFRSRYEFENGASSFQSIFLKMTPPLEQLDYCLALLGQEERDQLDGVLISGDLTEYGSAEDYRLLRGELERRFPGVPLVVTLGNHDNRAAFREGWLGISPDSSPCSHTMRIGDISILSLDNSEAGNSDGVIDQQRCDWLKKASEAESGRTQILMMHHHLLPHQAAFPACSLKADLESVLQQLPISAILCGHTHQLFRGNYAGIPYRTAMSISFIGEDFDWGVCMREGCGFSLYRIENGVIVLERHEASNPDKVLGTVRF